MTLFHETNALPDDFAGITRVFPLPNLIVFPHVIQALHIFEPRYREMLEDALAGDQLISMALLQPGWESQYEARPSMYPTICIGRVTAHARLEDGRYNVLLHGLRRGRVMRELSTDAKFRLAEVAVLEDIYSTKGAFRRAQIQRDLLQLFRKFIPDSPVAHEQFEQLLALPLPLGTITDVVAFYMPFELDFKRELLEELDVDRRAGLLLEKLRDFEDGTTPGRGENFPPEFSEN